MASKTELAALRKRIYTLESALRAIITWAKWEEDFGWQAVAPKNVRDLCQKALGERRKDYEPK